MNSDMNAGTILPHGRSPVPSAHPRVAAAAVVLSLALAACAQAGATQPPTTSLPIIATPTAGAPTAAPTPEPPAPTPLNPAPAEMLGTWTYAFAEGDVATIEIEATRVSIERLGSSRMRLGVIGDELVLSNSNLCAGEGRYAWSLDGDQLRFDVIGADPCDGRQKSFDGVTYTRVPG